MTTQQVLLALHLLFLSVGMGIGFSNIINMRLSRTQTGDLAKGLGMHRMAMMRYSDIAAAGIVVTGILLVWLASGVPGDATWFAVKMIAVLVFIVAYGGLRMTVGQLRRTGNTALMGRIAMLAPLTTGSAVVALVCAVVAFSA